MRKASNGRGTEQFTSRTAQCGGLNQRREPARDRGADPQSTPPRDAHQPTRFPEKSDARIETTKKTQESRPAASMLISTADRRKRTPIPNPLPKTARRSGEFPSRIAQCAAGGTKKGRSAAEDSNNGRRNTEAKEGSREMRRRRKAATTTRRLKGRGGGETVRSRAGERIA